VTEVLSDAAERIQDWAKYAAVSLGVDYLEATGQMPHQENFAAFSYNGYFDYDPNEIVGRYFVNWQEFHAQITQEYDLHREQKQAETDSLIQIIELDKQVGSIDSRLFRETRKENGRYIFLDTEVDDQEKIRRYFTYKVIEEMLGSVDDETSNNNTSIDPLSRRTSIVLGINVENGKKIGSTFSEVSKSKKIMNVEEVKERFEVIAQEKGWLDYTEPELRVNYLRELIRAANIVESLPLPANTKIYEGLNPDYLIDVNRRLLILGKVGLVESVDGLKPTNRLIKLGHFLLNSNDFRPLSTEKRSYKNWQELDYLRYGSWLLKMVEASGGNWLNKEVLDRASKLKLGPSAFTIFSAFGGLVEFNRKLGVKRVVKPRGFDDWDFNDYVVHIQRVAEEEGERPTRAILWRRIQEQGLEEPSPEVMRKVGGLSRILQAANIDRYNRPYSEAECRQSGILFYEAYGRVPKAKELGPAFGLPSEIAIRRIYGSVGNFQYVLEKEMQENFEPIAA
jgi:hypothetical protein